MVHATLVLLYTSLCDQEQYSINMNLGGLSELQAQLRWYPKTLSLCPCGKAFLRMGFSVSSSYCFLAVCIPAVWGTHFILLSVVGVQDHSKERICLLPGGCLSELLTLIIGICMSSLVSQVPLCKNLPSSDLGVEPRRLREWLIHC